MATILDFNGSQRGRRRAAGRAEPAQPAEILFFPGVRYERWGDEAASSRSRRNRDRTELGE